jgi:uncharacterized membrane protein
VLRHIQSIIARNKGDMDEYEKHRIKSTKIHFTIFKFILPLASFITYVYEMAVENGLLRDRNYRSRFSHFNQNIFSSPYTFWIS